ncbi:unnamed protein product, partial [Ilex paraguariensis]
MVVKHILEERRRVVEVVFTVFVEMLREGGCAVDLTPEGGAWELKLGLRQNGGML